MGVGVLVVAAGAFIGQGGHDAQPQTMADAYWRLHTERTEAGLVVQDLPDDYLERGLADKFVES